MKLKIAAVLVLVVTLAIPSVLSLHAPVAAASSSVQVVPVVTVASTGVLTIVSGTNPANNNAIEFGTVAAGSTTNKSIVLAVSANSGWNLQVSKNQNLTDGGYVSIPSGSLRFTSNGPVGPTYVTSPTEFGAVATPTTVVSSGDPASAANITVSYSLNVPASQAVGYYSAFHTYTLVVT